MDRKNIELLILLPRLFLEIEEEEKENNKEN